MLQRHPFVGLSQERAAGRIVFELADSAFGDGGIQAHVSAVESVGCVVKACHGEWNTALETCNPGLQQQCNRVGPWHMLSRDAANSGTRNRQESARTPVPL